MKQGGILAAGAALLIAGGAFVLAAGSGPRVQAKELAPLDTKGDASVRPWKRYDKWPTRDESKFNTLAKISSPPAPKEPRKLSGPVTGDAVNGAKLVANRKRGGLSLHMPRSHSRICRHCPIQPSWA